MRVPRLNTAPALPRVRLLLAPSRGLRASCCSLLASPASVPGVLPRAGDSGWEVTGHWQSPEGCGAAVLGVGGPQGAEVLLPEPALGRPQEHHGTATSLGCHRSHLTPSPSLPARRLDPLLGGQGVRPDRIPPLGAPSCTPRGCRRGLCPGGAPASPHCGPSPSTLHTPCPRCTPSAAHKPHTPHKPHASSASWAPPAPRSAWAEDPGGHFAAQPLPALLLPPVKVPKDSNAG